MNARRHPSDIQDSRLLAVLDRYVPPIIARSIVERARREAVSGPDVSWTDPNGLLDRISVGVRLFAAPEHVAAILRGITDLAADDQEPSPSSGSFEDNGPASTLKPASVRARAEETRVRVEEQPPTRRDIPPAPISSPNAVPPASKRDAPGSRDPLAREAPSSREAPPSRDAGATRDAPLSRGDLGASREALPPRRDTDVASFTTLRTPSDQGSGSRGVFSTSGSSSSHRDAPGRLSAQAAVRALSVPQAAPDPSAQRALSPLTTRSSGRGPAIEGIPAIPPPPPAANLREPRLPAHARPTPPVPAPQEQRSSTSITQQSLPRVVQGTPPPASPRAAPTTTAAGQAPRVNTPAAPAHPRPNAPGRPSREIESREITITLETEHDIPRARQVAREICESLGTRALTQQRLVTIVSELGRNMVLYAGGGRITLRPPGGGSRRVIVLAIDQGPGIANLSEIMAGRYKSRSGLGLGIVGTKRLADAFHIDTGRHGTAISVEVLV